MIRFKTINVDGMEIERTFESFSEILKNWWDEEQACLVEMIKYRNWSLMAGVSLYRNILRK